MKQDTITSFQYSTLLFFLLNSFLMNVGYHTFLVNRNVDCLIDVLLGGVLILIFCSFLFYFQRKTKESLLSYMNHHFTKGKRILFLLFFFLIIGFCMIYTFHTLSSFIHYFVLKDIPIVVITATLIITILYTASKGIPTIGKLSEILFYFYLFLFLIGMIGVISSLDITSLKPFFTSSTTNHIETTFTYFFGSIIPLFLLLEIANNQIIKEKKKKKLPYILLLVSILLTFTQLLFIISTLGIRLANIYEFPDMVLYKKISFLNLLERVETILAFQNLLNSFFFLVLGTYLLKEILLLTTKRKKEHIIDVLIGLIFFLTSSILSISSSTYLWSNFVFFFFLLFLFKNLTHYKHNHK